MGWWRPPAGKIQLDLPIIGGRSRGRSSSAVPDLEAWRHEERTGLQAGRPLEGQHQAAIHRSPEADQDDQVQGRAGGNVVPTAATTAYMTAAAAADGAIARSEVQIVFGVTRL